MLQLMMHFLPLLHYRFLMRGQTFLDRSVPAPPDEVQEILDGDGSEYPVGIEIDIVGTAKILRISLELKTKKPHLLLDSLTKKLLSV